MGGNSDEEFNIKKKLQEILASNEYHNKLKELQKGLAEKTKRQVEQYGKYTRGREDDTRKAFQMIAKNKERGDMDRSIHTSNIASMLIDATGRLEALVKFFVGKTHNIIGRWARDFDNENIGFWGQPWHATHKVSYDLQQYVAECIEGKKQFDIPDLAYFVDIEEDGALSQSWHDIENYFVNNDSIIKLEGHSDFVMALQNAISNWIDTLEDDGGYFISAKDSDEKCRVYPKIMGFEDDSGNWNLSREKVLEFYNEDDCEELNSILTPKPGVDTKDNKQHPYLLNEEFKQLIRDKNLGSFLENKFDGVGINFRPKP